MSLRFTRVVPRPTLEPPQYKASFTYGSVEDKKFGQVGNGGFSTPVTEQRMVVENIDKLIAIQARKLKTTSL